MTEKQKLAEVLEVFDEFKRTHGFKNPEKRKEYSEIIERAARAHLASLTPCEGERAAMAAEVERLRGALEQTLKAYIAVMSSHYDYPNDAWIDRPNKVREEAQSALAGGKEG